MAKKQIKEKAIEEALWESANKLRGSVEPSEYKHVVLSLIFLKYANDRFTERRNELVADGKEAFADNPVFYNAKNVFYLEPESRWDYLIEYSKQNDIAIKIDKALAKVEQNNPTLKGALPSNYYAGLSLDRKFTIAEGKGKGEYYTPKTIVNLIAEMIEPYRGKIYDPCCGSGGMFVQSMKFIEAHHGNKRDISVYGQEYTNTTYKLAKMNLAIRGIACNLIADNFHNWQHEGYEETYHNEPEYCYSATLDEIEQKGWSLVPSKYIEFRNRDEQIDFDTKMRQLQAEMCDLLQQEEESKQELRALFEKLGYNIEK